VVRALLTACILILEMKGDQDAVIPIMAVSVVSYVALRILSREPLYQGLSHVFIAAAVWAQRTAGAELKTARK